MASTNNQRKVQHLLLRASFGETPAFMHKFGHKNPKEIVKNLFKNSKTFTDLKIFDEPDDMFKDLGAKTKEERAGIFKSSQERIRDLNVAWIEKLVNDPAQLREKMTLFWHSFFPCRGINGFFMQNQNNTIRRFALGKYGDLLNALAKDAALILYLGNNTNTKDNVNDAFARFLLSKTLGKGYYSEKDVKSAARAFTGWSFLNNGTYQYNIQDHDADEKEFLQIKGPFTGEEIITILLQHKVVATNLVTRVYRYFVNETIDEEHIDHLTNRFIKSQYDIGLLMKDVFSAKWFYDEKNIGVLFKSPIQLLVNMKKTFGIKFEDEKNIIFLQKVLGQVLFYPTSIDGWSSGRDIIDSSSLMLRLRLSEYLFNIAEVNLFPKEEGDVETDYLSEKDFEVLRPLINWAEFGTTFIGQGQEKMLEKMSLYLLQHPLNKKQKELLIKETDQVAKSNPVMTMALKITTLPEFQLC